MLRQFSLGLLLLGAISSAQANDKIDDALTKYVPADAVEERLKDELLRYRRAVESCRRAGAFGADGLTVGLTGC